MSASAEHGAGIRLSQERAKAAKILGKWETVGSPPCRGLPKENLGGVVFGCTNETIEECFSLRLFGSPAAHNYVQNISVGLPLFLFNYDDRTMEGIFKAASSGGWNLNPYAWKKDGKARKYPAQVRVAVQEYCQPVPEAEYSSAIQENYLDGTRFMFELTKSQASALCRIFRGRLKKMAISEPASFGRYSKEFVMAAEGSSSMLRSVVDAEIPWIEPCEQQQVPLSHSLTPIDCTDKHVSVQETCDDSILIDEQQTEMPEVGDVQMWKVVDDEHKNEMPEEQVCEVVDDEHKYEMPEEQVCEVVDAPGDLKMADAEKPSSAVGTDKSSIIFRSSFGGQSEGGPDANRAYGQTEKVEFHNILQKIRRFEAQRSERALEKRQKALESTQVGNLHPELESLAQIRTQNQRVSTLRGGDSMLAKAVTKSVSICAEAFTEMQQGMCELKSIIEDLKIKCLQADMLRTKKAALLDSATDTSSQLSSLKLDVLELKLKLLSLSYCC